MGNKSSTDLLQEKETRAAGTLFLHGPEVERLQKMFPNWKRSAIEDVLTKCKGDEQKAADAMFQMSVQLNTSPAFSAKQKRREQEKEKRRRRRKKKNNQDPEVAGTTITSTTSTTSTTTTTCNLLSGPIPRPMTAEAWDDVTNQHSWFKVPGETFDVRVGPNYRKNKTKAPSLSTWYETVIVGIFTSNVSPGWLYSHIEMPPLSWEMPPPSVVSESASEAARTTSNLTLPLPTHIIWNMQYPIYNPTIFKTQYDGDGIVIYVREGYYCCRLSLILFYPF